RGDDVGPAGPEDRSSQQRVRLPGTRAEIGAEQRIGEVDADAERGYADGSGQRVPGVVDFGAAEQDREAGRECGPQGDEMPDRTSLVERHQARRIVVRDRLRQRLALDLDVVVEILLDLVGQLLWTVPVLRRFGLTIGPGHLSSV